MTGNGDHPTRKRLRLPQHDYARVGGYFVTVCTHGRTCLFGDIAAGQMRLNAAGRMVARWWEETARKFPGVRLDAFVTMPNHLHGMIVLQAADTPVRTDEDAGRTGPPPGMKREGDRAPTCLPEVMQWFKTRTTNAYIRGVREEGWPPFDRQVWQRSYYDRVIRDEADADRIRQYIIENPGCWESDEENPDRIVGYA